MIHVLISALYKLFVCVFIYLPSSLAFFLTFFFLYAFFLTHLLPYSFIS